MPYSAAHKQETRARIIETARCLFNRNGFESVSIDMIMEASGLTRGGFYNHFKNKEALYCEAVESFLMGRGKVWRDEAGIDPANLNAQMAQQMITAYLSGEHLGDLEGQCPMIALPSDIARAGAPVRTAYAGLLEAMTGLLSASLSAAEEPPTNPRETALSMAALCIGGMVIARTLPDSALAEEVRTAALNMAMQTIA